MTWRVAPLNAIALSALLLINAWLLAVVVAELASDNLPAADKVDWSFNQSKAGESVVSQRAIAAYSQILTRPVFFKSREPFVPAPPPMPKAAPPPAVVDPGLLLGGIMIKGGVRKAYVFSKAKADGAWVNEREAFMGWEVRSISKTGAKLEQQGRSIELQLYPER